MNNKLINSIIMKRIFTFGLMLAGAFALTNCAEELIDPTVMPEETTQEAATPEKGGIPFKLYASLDNVAETKTSAVNENGVLKTKWAADDEITVYYQSVDNTTVHSAGTFEFEKDASDEDIANGLFSGVLPDGFAKDGIYNWYFVYKGTVDTGTGEITVDIPNVQEQSSENALTHIGGVNCPMWGKAENISGSVTPRVQMEHLVSLYKFTVHNKTNTQTSETSTAGEGDIRIYDVGLQVSTIGEWASSNVHAALAGKFKLDLKTGKLTEVGGAQNSYGIKLKLGVSSINLEPDETTEFYLVAAPVDVQSRAITETRYQSTSDASIIIRADEYNTLTDDQKKNYTAFDVIIRQDILDFVVNGSARPLPERDQFNYEKGKIYKYVLPIKRLAQPYESDILDLESYGGRTTTDGKSTHQVDEIIKFYKSASGEKKNWVEATPTKININGQDVLGYVLGNPDGTLGAVTITCFLKDLFNALPVGFYLSSWDGSPAELGIGDIKLWIPNYNTTSSESTDEISDRVGTDEEYTVTRSVRSTHKVDYTNLESRGNSIRMKDSGGALGSIAYYLLGGDENFALNGDLLLAFAPGLGSKIPFSNFAKQGYYSTDTENGVAYNSVVMNDVFSHKAIDEANLGPFLEGFGGSLPAIIELLNMKDNQLPKTYEYVNEIEEDIKYKKPSWLESMFGSDGITVTESRPKGQQHIPSWPPKEGDLLYGNQPVINTITAVYNALMAKELAGYKVGTMILSNPYDLIHMIRDAKVSIDLKTTSNGPCVVMWGIDVLGPDKSPSNN